VIVMMARRPLGDPAMLLATVGGVGLLPVAPGTWGSLVGVAIAWVVGAASGPLALLALATGLFAAGWWAAERVAARRAIADPGFIVIDEVVGQALVLAWVPPTPWAYAAGFILFRIADILKPWPIRAIERRFRNGFGVMADDVAAAVYAGIGLYLCLKIYGQLTHGT
jgi:phosphatidylglycerophosphatase A